MSKRFSAAQLRAIRTFDKELSVSAGAGSGKTTVLVERFLTAVTENGLPPDRILAITFTDKAAAEMKTRLVAECRKRGLSSARRALENAAIGTIHGFCARFLRENPIEAGIDPFFRVMNDGEAFIIAENMMDLAFETEAGDPSFLALFKEFKEEALRTSVRALYDQYRASGADESLFAFPKQDAAARSKAAFIRAVKRFESLYDAEKKRLNAYDFDDLLLWTYRLLSAKDAASRAVLERARSRFSLVLVDEYQDVSALQDRIIHLLKSGPNLFMVGDSQQSIYGFRFANPGVFGRHIESHRAGGKGENIVLSDNYRSRAEILAFVNGLFSKLLPGSEFIALAAAAASAAARPGAVELSVNARSAGDEDPDIDSARVLEAARTAERVADLVASGEAASYRDIALLFRNAVPSRYYEKELAERGIPYHAVKGKGFYEKPEIQDMIGALTVLVEPANDIALAGVLRSPMVGVSEDALYWLARSAKAEDKDIPLWAAFEKPLPPELTASDRVKLETFLALRKELSECRETLPVAELMGRLARRTDLEAKLLAMPGGRQRAANVRKLTELAAGFSSTSVAGVEDLVRYLKRLADSGPLEAEAKLEQSDRDAVTLSTIHAAKGLEFPVVIVCDMGGKGKSPSRGSFFATPEDGLGMRDDDIYENASARVKEREKAEELRMLYVAMTRAKDKLILSGSVSLDKNSEYKAETNWMHRTAAALGWTPGASGVLSLGPGGAKAVIAEPAAVTQRRAQPAGDEEPALPRSFEAELAERLDTVYPSYEESRDLTVTDLLEASKKAPDDIEAVFVPEPEEPGVFVTPANQYGTIFHRFLEYCADTRPRKIVKNEIFKRITAALSADERERLFTEAGAFWESAWGRELAAAKRVYTELPFLYKTPRGLLKGQIDLVYQNAAGEWTILDYKTGQVSAAGVAEKAAGYALQIGLYVLVFKELTGELPDRGVLYFSSCGAAHTRSFRAADLPGEARALAQAYEKALTVGT